MPKVVDNYVFQRKIGSGQYGDVFKGYNKYDKTDIAIKAIKRESIKGKFMQLLENEIKVLKTCDNRNIIKLYDIKKTANNFYLILQYCNQGDLMAYLKKKKTLSQEQAIQFFIQMLNAFKTLVKYKIMHRDFKLANILMHDGEIKIADFGFSKLLENEEYTETMLGSPLNMAPQVLGGNHYNIKADIWSIGTCFYQLLFGTPPYKAANMVDLVNNIKNKPLRFPKQINKISDVTEDVIRKMLIVDPKKRIDWQDLFKHPINTFFEDKIKADMSDTMKDSDDMELNMSKFYLKNNAVVDHPKQIVKRQNINNYTYEIMQKKQKTNPKPFQGEIIKRQVRRSAQRIPQQKQQKQQMTSTQENTNTQYSNQTQNQKDIMSEEETEREKQIKAFKRNSNKLLHYRNIYVLLASVGEETMNLGSKYSDIAGYMLIRKLLLLLQDLKQKINNKISFPGMDYWPQYLTTKDYQDIKTYIQKQHTVFQIFSTSIHNKLKPTIAHLDPQTESVYHNPKSPLTEKVYQRVLRDYVRGLYAETRERKFGGVGGNGADSEEKKIYVHISRILDCLAIEEVFVFERNGVLFDFRGYYGDVLRMSVEELRKMVEKKLSVI